MNENQRYEAGLVSLAREVLKDGLRRGEKGLDKSIWAEFLLWHQKQMNAGTAFKRAHVEVNND